MAVDAETVGSVPHRQVTAAAGSSASALRPRGAGVAVEGGAPGAWEAAVCAVPAAAHPYRASRDVRGVGAGSRARLCLMPPTAPRRSAAPSTNADGPANDHGPLTPRTRAPASSRLREPLDCSGGTCRENGWPTACGRRVAGDVLSRCPCRRAGADCATARRHPGPAACMRGRRAGRRAPCAGTVAIGGTRPGGQATRHRANDRITRPSILRAMGPRGLSSSFRLTIAT